MTHLKTILETLQAALPRTYVSLLALSYWVGDFMNGRERWISLGGLFVILGYWAPEWFGQPGRS